MIVLRIMHGLCWGYIWIVWAGYSYPKNGESDGTEHGKLNREWVFMVVFRGHS